MLVQSSAILTLSMPRENQPVVRSSVEARRIWTVYNSTEVDENFHPLPNPHYNAPPIASTSSPKLPPLTPYQRQLRPCKVSESRLVERQVFRQALGEVENTYANRSNDSALRIELKRVKQQRDVLLRHNVVLAKCMEQLAKMPMD